MLVVDCCIRGEESATRKYYRAYLEKAGIPAEEIMVLDLSREEVASLDADGLRRRDDLCARKAFDDAMFAFARPVSGRGGNPHRGPVLGSVIPGASQILSGAGMRHGGD